MSQAGDVAIATAQVSLLQSPPLVIDEKNQTLFYADPASGAFVLRGPLRIVIYNFGRANAGGDETVNTGYLSIRREGDRLIGGIYLECADPQACPTGTFKVGGPFDLPVPE
jgi:hypothetical protein